MIFKHLTKASDKLPPELVPLFVSNMADDIGDRNYAICQFARKDTLLENEYVVRGRTSEERMLDILYGGKRAQFPAPRTGYYYLVGNDETGLLEWLPLSIPVLDSGYMIINPEEDPNEQNIHQ